MNGLSPALNRAGQVLAVATCGWVLYRIAQNRFWTLPADTLTLLLGRTLLAVPLYAAAGLLLAGVWWHLLNRQAIAPPSFGRALAVYARTQLAKYLPGNVFHLIGRHALGSGLGLPHRVLAGALVVEIGGLGLVATALAGTLGAPFPLPPRLAWLVPGTLLGLAMAGLALGLLGLRWIHSPGNGSVRLYLASLARALLGYGGFFAILGGITALLFGGTLPPGSQLPWTQLTGLAALAWLGGFATPGAPAGIGVRDAILLSGLGGLAPEPEATGVVVALRLVTLGGDLLFGLAGLLLPLQVRGHHCD